MHNKTKLIGTIILSIAIILIVIGCYFSTKFKNAKIELGKEVTINDFIRYGSANDAKMDISKVKNEVGEYNVKVKYMFVDYDLSVKISDTTPPDLEVENIYKPLDYEFDINDFIVKLEDSSEYDVEVKDLPVINKYGEYPIRIVAKDIYNNITQKDCVLSIGWVKKEISVEVGNTIKPSDLLFDMKNINAINQSDLDDINKKREGTYYLKSVLNNSEINVKIEKTKDVTPPTLELKDVTIYENKKVNSVNDFVQKLVDVGSTPKVSLLTDINYSKTGSQKVQIEASDNDGNKVVKEAELKIIKDTFGPQIKGVSKLTVNKGTNIDYKKGVSAYDENFGNCPFEVDTSSVDITKYGNYYAIYTSVDNLGNKTTVKRVVVVNHDKTDTNNLVANIAGGLSSNAEEIRDYVRNNIKYNTNAGGSDPIWYGLNNKVGNCIVHAYIFDALLKLKGYDTKIIWTTDKTHYWNMVYLNGKWVHMDSTPTTRHNKYSIMNDELRYERLQGRDWDRNLWPKAL